MRWGLVAGIAVLLFFPRTISGEGIQFSESEQQQLGQLRDFCWLNSLTGEQISAAASCLKSAQPDLVQSALEVVAVHEIEQLTPEVSSIARDTFKVDGRLYNTALAGIVLDGLKSRSAMVQEIKRHLIDQLPGDDSKLAECGNSTVYIRGRLTSILVIKSARLLRLGKKQAPDTSGLELSSYHVQLLRHSAMPEGKAIDSIARGLSHAELIGRHESDLIAVLDTYRKAAISPVLEQLASNPEATFTEYGKYALLMSLRNSIELMDDFQLRNLCEVIPEIRSESQNPSLLVMLSYMESNASSQLDQRKQHQ